MTYVLVYDRKNRHIVTLEEFTEAQQAQADELRQIFEERYRSSTEIEVVTLISDGRETLRQTHSRYFLADEEIIAAIDHRVA